VRDCGQSELRKEEEREIGMYLPADVSQLEGWYGAYRS